jgi:hypothetical protein
MRFMQYGTIRPSDLAFLLKALANEVIERRGALLHCMNLELALGTGHCRQPRRLLTKGTPAAGVTRPIIDSCDSVTHASAQG